MFVVEVVVDIVEVVVEEGIDKSSVADDKKKKQHFVELS